MGDNILSVQNYRIMRTILWNLIFLLWFGAGYKLGWLAVGLCVFCGLLGFCPGAAMVEEDLVRRGILKESKQ